MSNFKVGEKVVCIGINNVCIKSGKTFKHPNINDIVIIRGIESYNNNIYLFFEEYPRIFLVEDLGYEAFNFRKLDHQFGEDVIAEIIKQVKEESLTLSN